MAKRHTPTKTPQQNILLLVGVTIGPVILILQQGIVPIFKKLSHDGNASIFLALHLPKSWQWLGITGIILVGLYILSLAIKTYNRAIR